MAPRVGLVLGGGGIVATAFHAGVLTALHDELGWDARTAETVVGTSAGAITAVSLRAGIAPADLADGAMGRSLSMESARALAPLFAAPLFGASRTGGPATDGDPEPSAGLPAAFRRRAALAALARHPAAVRPGLVLSVLVPRGRIPTRDIARLVDRLLPGGWPAATTALVAVRLHDLRRVVFGLPAAPPAGVGEAVAASCAVPGLFAPVPIGEQLYVDGGAYSVTNVDVVAGADLDLVVVSSPMSYTGDLPSVRRGRSTYRLAQLYLTREARQVEAGGVPVLVVSPTDRERLVMGLDLMDAGRRHAVAAAAYDGTRRMLAESAARDKLRAGGLG